MKKNILGSFREKAGMTRKTAISAISAVLAVALIATVAFGFIPDTAIKASAESIGLISSVSGKNYLPDTYTAVNVPAGTYTMTEDQYKTDSPQKSENGVAAFDFHIFAKNFASKAHTCGNIAVENLGAPTAGATGAPEFGSRPNHDTTSIKLSYAENISDWSTSAQADAFVFGPNNTVTENTGQVFVETPSGKYMMGNGKALMDKTYIDDATPFIDIDAELTEAENYQRYLVWLMEDVREKAKNYYTPGWGYATQAENGETVRVLTHPDVAGWGWMGTTIDFSKYPEDTIIVDLDLYEGFDWWTGKTNVGSNAQNLINGSVTLKGTAGKRIIFNVESSSGFNADSIKFADTNMKADKMGNSEDSVNLDNNILWNFYNSDDGVPNSTSGTITVGGTWMGTILAPNATVKCSAGLNGSIIAKNVTTSAETHKSDYTGEKVTKSDETSIKVTKIWQNDDPNTRPGFITVKLLQNNKAIKTVQLSKDNVTADGTWEYTFDKLPVTDGRGTSYRYDIEEVVPKGYTSNIVNNTIINTGNGETSKVGSLTFNKRPEGDATKFLKEAEFKLTIDNGASLAGVTATGVSNFKATDGAVTWTSTDSAAVFSNLPYGNYTITETKAPAGYVTSNPVTVKVDGPAAAKADMTDKQIEIKLAKLEGKNNEFLPGATMELTPNWGTSLANVKVEGVTTTSHDANKITWTSGKNAVTIKGIPAGSYTLTETNAPMGYDKAAPMTFIVEADGTVKVNSAAVSRVDMINNLTPAVIKTYTINIGKKDAAGSSVSGAVLKLTSVNGSDLSGVTVDGQAPSLSDSNKSITWTSGSAPAVFENLPVGSYTLTEVTAPAGYKLAGQMSITVSADGQSFDMIDEAIEMTISKQDSETYKELAGATLKLESDKDLTGVVVTGAKPDSVVKDGKIVTWVTNGNVVSFSKLPAGSYTLTETGKPAGYKTAAEIKFEIDAEGKVTGTNINGNTCTMYDEPVTIKIGKQYTVKDAETGENVYGMLAGAALQLSSQNKNIDLSSVTGSIPVEHPDAYTIAWTSGSVANNLHGIPDGTYVLHETEAPEGFILAEDITIVIENGVVKSPTLNNSGEITMTDEKEQFHSMVFTKIDADEYISNGDVKLVSGAKLGVFAKDTVSFAPENAALVFTSSSTPEKVMLPDGDYVLVELEAPEGYEKTSEKMYFTVNNGTLSVTGFDAAELASASYGKPSDDGLGVNEECYYTLETTGIFEQYGYLPDKVHFTIDGTTQYYLNEFTLYKSDASKTPPTETVVVTKDDKELATSWDATIPSDAVYDPNCTYYAVLKLADSNNQQLTSDSTPKINLMFSYTGVSSEGASEQLTTSTTGTYTVGNCNGQVLEITKSNIDTYGYPEIVVSYNKDNAYANAYCNQSGLRLFVYYTRPDGGSDKKEKDISPTSGLGDTSKGQNVVFSQAAIEAGFSGMISAIPEGSTITSYKIQMTTFAMQGAGNDSSSIPLDVTANYAGGAVGGGDVDVDIDIKDNFESKKEELSGSTNDTTDPIAVKIRESVGGETAYLVLPNYNTPPSYKNMCAVEITKTDLSGKAITGSSASFLLYNENNELVGSLYGTNGVYAYNADKTTANPANNADAPLVTDPATGMVKITGLDQGKYYLVETDAPSSYEASENETVFALTLSNIEKNPQKVTVKNTLKKGNITLIKTDDNGVLKEGASFDLYRVKLESINSTNPTGEYVGTYTTLNDGKYTVEVDLGYLYYAIEKTAPDGTTNTNVTNATIFPQLATTGMDATRYVINGHNITYGVVLTEDIGTGNVKIQTATGLDDAGNIVYADKVNYEVDEDGKSTNVVKGMDVYEGSIGAENTAIDTTIAKIDETGAALAGATLKLEANGKTAGYVKSVFAEVTGTIAFEHRIEYVYTTNAKGETVLSTDADGRPYIKSEYITWTSGDAANVLSGLPAGEYTLTELDAPEGYAVASPVTVTAGGSVTMTDKPLTGEITLKKNDALTNAVIAGVDFTLQVSDDGTTWTDTDKTCTTGADGTAKVTGLTYGKYYRFKETSTPAGYEANTGDAVYTHSVQITEDNLTSSVIRFENTAKTGKITLEKVDKEDTGVKLEDAVFELYYKASTANDSTYILYPGAATYTTNENGQIVVENLPWGYTYKFKEVGTPTGYVESNAETAPIVLTASELEKNVTVENSKMVASLNLTGTKTITGKDSVNVQFDFAIMENGKDVVTAKNVGGNITFPAITYTYENVGDHTYTIYEKDYNANGITHDKSTYTLVVNVALTDGELVVTQKSLKKGDADVTSIAFVNTYTASGIEATVEGTKTLNGKTLTDGAFTFELIETGADFNTVNKTAETTTNLGTAFSFTKNYTEAGTHYYVIKEQIPAETKGITYDTAEYHWTVVVEDNGTGNLVVKSKTLTTKDGTAVESGKAAFTNTYTAAGTNATIEGVKTLNGKALADGAFTFELIETAADFATTGKTAKTVTNTGTAFSFTENYTAAGTHYYVIKEQIPAETKGITYDTAEYHWTVVVEDNGTGSLVIKSKTLTKDGTVVESGKAAFTNTYAAAGTNATIEGVKTLNGKALTDGAFTFELIETAADFATTGKTAKTVTNTGTAFSFTENYTAAGTHYYVIKEQIPAETKGITYDTAEYRWTVVVEDNGTGSLVIKSKTLTKDGTTVESGKAAFTNTYTASASEATIEGVKTLNGKTLTDNAFTFELIETGADFNTTGKTAKTTTNSGTAFYFTESYTAAGTHYYVIKEQIPADTKGITYDTAEYRWTVVVEDNGTGSLVIKSKTLTKDGTVVESGKAAFTNTYTAASVTATINGTKTLDGKAPAAEAFTFELWSAKAEDGKYVADSKLKEFKNGADGKFTVETDAITAEGTYYFIVKEAIPEGAVKDVYNGITYDNSEYLWTVEVEDNGTGNLVASKAVDAKGEERVLEFANTTARETVKFSKKVAGGGNELPGATIEIAPVGSITFDDSVTIPEGARKTATNITWVSGRDAVEISGLPVGIYTMTETAAPAGYAMAPEVIYFRIADDGTIYSVPASEYKADGTTAWKAVTNDTVIMEDAPYTSVFSKKAADVENELAGAKLSIKPIGTVNLGNVILPDGATIVNGAITWTSTTEPKTIGALPNGVYEFTETQAPQGYEIAKTIYVKIDGDKVYSVIGDAYTGETTVWGDAAEDDKVTMVDNVNQAVFSKQAMTSEDELPGAILTLKLLNTDTTLSNVIRPTGVTLLSDNRTLTWRSDDESKVIGKLPDGIYEFTEVTAPSGYEKAETIYVLIDGGDVYSVTKAVYDSAEGTVDWGTPVRDDKIVMKDDYNKAVFSKQATNAGGELPGAKLTLTPVVSTTDISKVKVPEGVTNKDGVISWTSGEEEVTIGWLPDGVYKFTEVTAPSGYEVAETIYVKIDNGGVHSVPAMSYDGEDTVWSAAEDGDRVIMKDAPNSLVISKQAVGGGSELAGAKLTLAPVVSTTDISKVVVSDGVDNKDGVISWTSGKKPVTLNMVPDGVYKFTEIQAPDKYDIAETIYIKVENGEIFSVNESDYDGEDTIWGIAVADDKVIMLDALTPAPGEAKFEFTKYTDAGFTISGAVFKLTGSNGYSRAVTSGSTGAVTFDGLTEGTYTLVETAAPQKFVKSAAAVYITVDAEGKMIIKNEDGQEITIADVEALMTNKVIPIEDEKKGKEGDVIDLYTELVKTNKEYEDITITWESSDDTVASVDANGKVTLKKPGTATITAKSGDTVLGTFVLGAEAQAPADNDVPYTGDTDTPQTGDYAVGWTIALSAILLASGVTAKISYDAIKRRRNAKAK